MGTWITGAVVLLILGLAARKIYTDKKSGKGCAHDCGHDCAGCGQGCGHDYGNEMD